MADKKQIENLSRDEVIGGLTGLLSITEYDASEKALLAVEFMEEAGYRKVMLKVDKMIREKLGARGGNLRERIWLIEQEVRIGNLSETEATDQILALMPQGEPPKDETILVPKDCPFIGDAGQCNLFK